METTGMKDDGSINWVARAGAKAKGKRPAYFADPAIDRILSIVMALAGEVSVLRERMDTIERLLDANGSLRRKDIETYEPDRDAGAERGLATQAYIARIMRGVQQDMESLSELNEPSIEDISRHLKEI
jgi:hypothetical protein